MNHLDSVVAQAVAALDPSMERKAACHEAANAFHLIYGRPKRQITTAVGVAPSGGWCVYAYAETKRDLVGVPQTFQGFSVRHEVIGRVRARGVRALTAPAPAPSAEAQTLIGALKSSAIGYGTTGREAVLATLKSDKAALSTYIARLEAEVERLREWSHKQAMDIITLGQMAIHPTKDETHA